MKIAFSEHLRKIYASEEHIVQKINYVLEILLSKTDLPKQDTDEIRSVLRTLTQDSVRHERAIREIIDELEHHDN